MIRSAFTLSGLLFVLGCFHPTHLSNGRELPQGVPAFDPRQYVHESLNDERFVRNLIRMQNGDMAVQEAIPAESSIEAELKRRGRPVIPLVCDEIRRRGIRTQYFAGFVDFNGRDPLLVGPVFEEFVRIASRIQVHRISADILSPKDDWRETPDNQELYELLKIIRAQGRLAVPYLILCIRSDRGLVRTLGLDFLRCLNLGIGDEEEYERFLQSDSLWTKPVDQVAREILQWWDANSARLNWDPASFSFRQ